MTDFTPSGNAISFDKRTAWERLDWKRVALDMEGAFPGYAVCIVCRDRNLWCGLGYLSAAFTPASVTSFFISPMSMSFAKALTPAETCGSSSKPVMATFPNSSKLD